MIQVCFGHIGSVITHRYILSFKRTADMNCRTYDTAHMCQYAMIARPACIYNKVYDYPFIFPIIIAGLHACMHNIARHVIWDNHDNYNKYKFNYYCIIAKKYS